VVLEANGKSVRAVKPLDEELFHNVTFQNFSEGSPKVPGMEIAPRSSWRMPCLVRAMGPSKVKKSFEFKGREAS
jgi:hypothetical protein